MKPNEPSRTALMIARQRAAHQVLDHGSILNDPFAMKILREDEKDVLQFANAHPLASIGRLFTAARSRIAEDALSGAVERGVRQIVILGAGLDTFALRNPHGALEIRIYEVDHPATQAGKRERLAEAQIALPPWLVLVPVDFERDDVGEKLVAAGFQRGIGRGNGSVSPPKQSSGGAHVQFYHRRVSDELVDGAGCSIQFEVRRSRVGGAVPGSIEAESGVGSTGGNVLPCLAGLFAYCNVGAARRHCSIPGIGDGLSVGEGPSQRPTAQSAASAVLDADVRSELAGVLRGDDVVDSAPAAASAAARRVDGERNGGAGGGAAGGSVDGDGGRAGGG